MFTTVSKPTKLAKIISHTRVLRRISQKPQVAPLWNKKKKKAMRTLLGGGRKVALNGACYSWVEYRPKRVVETGERGSRWCLANGEASLLGLRLRAKGKVWLVFTLLQSM
jgi:hypothetical protein